MTQSLPKPAVTVTQKVRAPVPVTALPTLQACIVGVCNQVVPATLPTATGGTQINGQAQVLLPASAQAMDATGDPPVYSLNAKSVLEFSVTNGPTIDVLFGVTDDFTPADVVELITRALASAGEAGAYAKVIGTDPYTGTAFRILTQGKDESSKIIIDPVGRSAGAVTGSVDLSTLVYPGDVTGLTISVSVDGADPETITIASPGNAAALVAAISALTGATATLGSGNELVITSDYTGATSSIRITGGTLLAVVGLAVDDIGTGTGSSSDVLSAFDFSTKDEFYGASKYGGYELVVPPSAQPDPRGNLDQLVFDVSSMRAFLSASGGSSLREVLRTSALLRKATAAVTAVDDGNGDNVTQIINIVGQNFSTPTPTAAVITGTAAPSFASLSNKSVILSDGTAPRTVSFGTVSTIADVVNTVNAVFDTSDGLIASNSGGFLRLTSTRLREDGTTVAKGEDSHIVLIGGNGLAYLDSAGSPTLVAGRTTGNPHKAAVGDLLYVDGTLIGKIIQVAPSGNTARLKVDASVALTFTGTTFHIVAQNLKSINDGGATDRPAPDLIVEDDGQMVLKPGVLRTSTGTVVESVVSNTLYAGKASLYTSYTALRKDVTAAADAGLVSVSDTTLIESLLEPVDTRNPLALGLYLAKLNAPTYSVVGLGVEAKSSDEPYGTVAAYEQACSYLEQFEVYAIAPMTQSRDVAARFATHVNKMSAPNGRRERIALFNPQKPKRALDELLASGSAGNTRGASSPYTLFDTGVADMSIMLQEAGINPNAAIPASAGVYLDVASDSKRYSISAISGSTVTLRTSFGPGDNTDGFYSTSGFTDVQIDVAFAIRKRGAELKLSNGQPDKDKIADTYMGIGQSFSNKRVWVTAPDTCAALVDGIEQEIPGFYANACIAGMISEFTPVQSFTNVGMSGITRAIGSQKYLTEDQMDHMAYGGVYILIQEGATQPVIARQALTTDRSALENQTDSCVKVLDFVAKYQRQILRNFIGKTNLTQGTVDNANMVIQSSITFLTENSIVKNVTVDSFAIDPERKDGIVLEETVSLYYPTNSIAITLFV